jgi:hypothetical protein
MANFLDNAYRFLRGPGGKQIEDKVSAAAADSQSMIDQRNNLNTQSGAAGTFAGRSEDNFGQLGVEAYEQREALRRRANGQGLMSPEILRQGLQQQLGQQRSMAAGANPNSAPMAARTAAMQMGRASSGMAGQQAMATLAERQAAEKQLSDMIMGQRQQELSGALGSRQTAISGYGGITPEKSWLDRYGPAIQGVAGLATKGPGKPPA